jgi:hypothetical protein
MARSMQSMKRVCTWLALICALTGTARADQTTIGVTVNGTTGAHIEPYQSESIPFLPLPTIEIDRTHEHLQLHLEVMPPIGPVPLAQGTSNYRFYSQDPRVSYVSGEVRYLFGQGYALGLGETVLNQQTQYPPTPDVSSSRVVGLRLFGGATLLRIGNGTLFGSLAVSPSMQGLQAGYEPEHASLVDSSLRWSIDEGPYLFSYGVRYVNYTAAYTDANELADRNHLFMPFVAFDWRVGKHPRKPYERADPSWKPDRPALWHAGLSVLGTNGSRSTYSSSAVTPLPFVVLPLFSVNRTDAHSIVAFEGIPQNQSSNLFGSLGQSWSYMNADVLLRAGGGRYAFGVGESVVNLQLATPPKLEDEFGRSEGLHGIATAAIARNTRSVTTLRISVSPYLHLHSIVEFSRPIGLKSYETDEHGARVDLALTRTIEMHGYAFAFGLRYINQTTDYGRMDPYSAADTALDLTRSSALIPFIGANAPL